VQPVDALAHTGAQDQRRLYNASPSPLGSLAQRISQRIVRNSGFAGHFVLLTGVDAAREGYMLLDPAREREAQRTVPFARFDEARRAFGTDEDLIHVDLSQARRTSGEAS